ncbi:hypothetical protein [Pantoea agglomerans]|uniref:hypothetical protein n=1 Tax=Enterobacter agglomerans TaxID=549 RepID=UPI003C7CA098
MYLVKSISLTEEFVFSIKEEFVKNENFSWDLGTWGRGVSFENISTSNGKEPMSYFLSEFSKAYIYHSTYPNLYKSLAVLDVFKMINCVLRELCIEERIENLNYAAIDLFYRRTSDKYAYNTEGRMVSNFYKVILFLTEKGMIDNKILNCIPDKISHKKLIKNDTSKLPDQELVDFFGSVFNSKNISERDILTTSIIALLLCAPTRLSEVLNLKHDCEVKSTDSNGNFIYGISYIGSKGYGSHIKWVPKSMQSLARRAILNLRELSKGARSVAQLVSNGEKGFYDNLNVKPHEKIPGKKVFSLINFEGGDNINNKSQEIINIISRGGIEARKLWIILSGSIKDKSNWKVNNSIYESEALIILYKDQLHLRKGSDIFNCELLSSKTFFADFSFRKNDTTKNIYQRHAHLLPSDKSLKFNSHQLRHLLNTLAHEEYLSDLEISFWSGRRNVDQNEYYDHMSSEEKRENDRRVNLKKDIETDNDQKQKRLNSLKARTEDIKLDLLKTELVDNEDSSQNVNKIINSVIQKIELLIKEFEGNGNGK